MRRSDAFTILELLIAMTILLTLLASLGGVLVSTRRAYEANRMVTAAAARVGAAIEAMRYDIGLSGYCVDPAACDLGGPGLELAFSDEGGQRVISSITSRYEEDRYSTGVVQVTYRIEDGRLVRSAAGDDQEIAEGIQRLVLLGYRSSESTSPTRQFTRPPDAALSGLDLRLEYLQGESVHREEFTAALRNAL